TRGGGPAEDSAPQRRPTPPARRSRGVSRARARVGGEARGACLGRCHGGGAAYPPCRTSQVPTADCRTNQGLPCTERCRLGDVSQGPGIRGRGTGLARPLVRCEERIGCGEPGAVCK